MNFRRRVKQFFIEKENRRYERRLSERRMTYDTWIRRQEKEAMSALEAERAEVDFVIFVSGEGIIADGAYGRLSRYFAEHAEVDLLYGDEDVLQEGERRSPWFKPDWSPDLLDSSFYFGSLLAVRKRLVDRMERGQQDCGAELGLDTFSEGAGPVYRVKDFSLFEKWVHLAADTAGAYQRGSRSVGHVEGILFHSGGEEERQKYLVMSADPAGGQENLVLSADPAGGQENLVMSADPAGGRKPLLLSADPGEQERWTGSGSAGNKSEAGQRMVSVVIPSKDNPEMLERCLAGCERAMKTEASGESVSAEIIVVDNGSSEENKRRIREVIGSISLPVTYLYEPMEFHFSRMCNRGAKQARGSFLLFLNDDVTLCQPGCAVEMAALAGRPYTGAVGLKLYYPNSHRLQHAGITNLPMGPVHKLQFLSDDSMYYFNANRGLRNVIAVTAACLMVEKTKFEEAGGFAEELPVAFNDVDLCFTLYENGYVNVCVNDSYAYHHESVSRGDDESPEKRSRLLAERDVLYKRHPGMKGVDPYYSEGLSRVALDTQFRFAYETAGCCLQHFAGKPAKEKLGSYRRDACVLFRIEDVKDGYLQGYSVILGDNNACYEKKLFLVPESSCPEEGVYSIPLEGQYRPDLVDNLADQVNVGLCGFRLQLSEEALSSLSEGRYRIAVGVRNRVSGLRLTNESNCYLLRRKGKT